jgi:GT2 family glycosyltransferase
MKTIKLSVIIPCGFKRKLHITKGLESQTEKPEVIIERGQNPSENRNRGITKVKTPLVAFVNAHSLLPSDWTSKVIEFFDKYPEIDVVGGPQLTPPEDSYFGRVSGFALASVFGASGSSTRYKMHKPIFDADETYLTSANLICRKKVVDRVKFDEGLWPGEDPKFISDVKKAGFRIAFYPDIFIHHVRRPTVKDFAEQVFKYGAARPKKESLLETLKKPSFLVPSLFLIYLMFFSILSWISFIFLLPAVFYILLSLFFSLYESLKNRDLSAFLILPFIFFTIHISYGAGFIYGVISKV